jgi:hypothetical protein
MRAVLIAAVTAAGIAVAGVSAGLAAPVNGIVIANAAGTGAVLDQVHWFRFHHHHHHFFFHHHRHHRHWW